MVIFLAISTFKFFRKVVGGATTEITDPIYVPLMLKYHALLDSQQDFFDEEEIENATGSPAGFIEEALEYTESVTDIQDAHDANPIMLTVEEIEDDPVGAPGVTTDHLIGHSVDFKVNTSVYTLGTGEDEAPLNPAVTNSGNNLIQQLDGGKIDDTDVGLTWTTLIDNGDVKAPDGTQIVDLPPAINILPFISGNDLETVKIIPMPFLLFNQTDIA